MKKRRRRKKERNQPGELQRTAGVGRRRRRRRRVRRAVVYSGVAAAARDVFAHEWSLALSPYLNEVERAERQPQDILAPLERESCSRCYRTKAILQSYVSLPHLCVFDVCTLAFPRIRLETLPARRSPRGPTTTLYFN